MGIIRAPMVDGLDEFCAIRVGMLPKMISSDLAASIEYIKGEYLGIRNDSSAPARQRYERCLFRLYEAYYLVAPYVNELDACGFAFDDIYYCQMKLMASSNYDIDLGQKEYERALELIKEGNYVEAGKHFKKGAINGNSACQYNYAITVSNGEGVLSDPLEGAFWYFAAAQGDHAKAMNNLAIAYRRGLGVFPSGEMMLYWYAKASYLLFPDAIFNLGLSLQNEEVLRGNASIGNNLKVCARELNNSTYQTYAQKIAKEVIKILEGHVYNILRE